MSFKGIFKPSREQARAHRAEIISDLDDLISTPKAFKFLNKTVIIEPLTTENFIYFSQAYAEMFEYINADVKQSDYDLESIYKIYHKLIGTLCPSLTLKDIKQATLAQLNAMLNLLVDHIKGISKIQENASSEEESKKKTQKLKKKIGGKMPE